MTAKASWTFVCSSSDITDDSHVLRQVSSNSDCDNGDKFVIKNTAGVNRRQFLFMGGRTILAFVPRGQKFTQCSSYTEVTAQVDCKVTMFTSVTSVVIPELVVRGTPNYFWDWSIAAHMQRKICCCLSATLQPLSFVHNANKANINFSSLFKSMLQPGCDWRYQHFSACCVRVILRINSGDISSNSNNNRILNSR